MMDKMPEFKPSSVDQRVERALATRIPLHHSFSDWDFENVNWVLDETIYHTAAPSLRGSAACVCTVKHATTGALSDGRVVAWIRGGSTVTGMVFYFRNQVADGSSWRQDCYMMYIGETLIQFYYYLGNVAHQIEAKAHEWEWAVDTWYKIRFTWWTSAGRMYLRVERWNGDSWETLGGDADTDFEDVNDRWKDEAVNRVGCGVYTTRWIDDMEVWG